MDETDNYHTQQTPPPSPYLETTWDLKLDQVREALLHPKEKKLGYLELYFAGFMEFVDAEAPPSPAMSDDETEYPRWGSVSSSRDQVSMSSATSVVSQDFTTSTSGDNNPLICASPTRIAATDNQSTTSNDYESAIRQYPPSLHSRRFLKRHSKHLHRRKPLTGRCSATDDNRVMKHCRPSSIATRTRSKMIARQSG